MHHFRHLYLAGASLRKNAMIAWRGRAAKRSHRPVTVTECQPQLGLRAIRCGSCGIVYEQPRTGHVSERAVNNGALAERCRLWNDLILHKTVEEAFAQDVEQSRRGPFVHVLHCSGYISREDKRWWAVQDRLLPKDHRCPKNLLRSERIPPFI